MSVDDFDFQVNSCIPSYQSWAIDADNCTRHVRLISHIGILFGKRSNTLQPPCWICLFLFLKSFAAINAFELACLQNGFFQRVLGTAVFTAGGR